MSQSYKEQVEAIPSGDGSHGFILGMSTMRELVRPIAVAADAALSAAREERDALRAECEALRKDAQRWKFLCEGDSDFVLYALEADVCYAGSDACNQAMDAAIASA